MIMRNASRIGGFLCAAAIAAFALQASAQQAVAPAPASPATVIPTYNAMDADTVSKIIQSQGQAQITPTADAQGVTLKVQMPNGVSYAVFMDDCDGTQPARCKSLEFRATLPPGALNFSQINSFNEKERYATAYLSDKGVPQLRMDENLRGGVTADFVAYAVRIFVKVLSDYIVQAK
jgi:hypothetical protein